MLVEAFSTDRHVSLDAVPGGLALGTTAVLFAGAAFAGAVWMVGVDRLGDLSAVAPYLILDRFTLFFDMTLCLGGALAALLAGGYLIEYSLERGEFYSLILLATYGEMMLAASGDALTLFLRARDDEHRGRTR